MSDDPTNDNQTEVNQSIDEKNIRGYGGGSVDAVISVDEVTRQAAAIAENIPLEQLDALAGCLLYTSPSPRDGLLSRMPSSA